MANASNVRKAIESGIREAVAEVVRNDHMTANATPKAQYVPITIARVADMMAALPVGNIFRSLDTSPEIDARAQAEGFIETLTAVPHRQPNKDGTYTYQFQSDGRLRVSPDNAGWFFKNVAGQAVSWAFKEAERASKDFLTYKTRNRLEAEARSDTAEGIDGDRRQTLLAQAEERAIDSIVAAQLALIFATALSDWSAKVTDGEPARGSERIAPQEGAGPKVGARKTGILD